MNPDPISKSEELKENIDDLFHTYFDGRVAEDFKLTTGTGGRAQRRA